LGFGVWGWGFGVWGVGCGVWSLGFGVWGLVFGVWGLGFKELEDTCFQIIELLFGFRVHVMAAMTRAEIRCEWGGWRC